ncbi:MAG: DUF3842 family protein [Oscillospiraceae bacterium]|nr:DUF3842 family protein [Oscillospiraceae bacterium]
MKTVLVLDGQGGGVGRALVEKLVAAQLDCRIVGVGTNAMATNAMLKAGALGATGENAAIVNARKADIIVGPMGIVLANSMMGEVSPAMAAAVGGADAARVLIPITQCSTYVAGISDKTLSSFIEDAVEKIKQLLQ